MKNEGIKNKLYDIHVDAGAKMVDFAGYQMPLRYTGIIEEHMAVREKAGLFDVSHMGEFKVSGKGATQLVQKLTCNNVSKLKKGKAQYTCLINENGGTIDDLIIYCLEDSPDAAEYLLVVNASNIEKDWNWIESHNETCEITNQSPDTGLLALQGPKATSILQKLTDTNLEDIKFYHFSMGSIAHIDDVIISATGYTGSGGFELYVENKYLDDLWYALMRAGKEEGLIPCGLGARDSLRLEKGYCLYGNELDEETSPVEAGLSWVVKTKNNDFIGHKHLAEQKKNGPKKKLIAFKMKDRRVPRKGYDIKNTSGELIGLVSSGTMSPCLDEPIGLGYVGAEYGDEKEILISRGKKDMAAEICKLPFV